MSFVTRCPACSTRFKVVTDQLKISDGWVRCGHCQQVFDATLDLQPWWPGRPGTDADALGTDVPVKSKLPATASRPTHTPSLAPASAEPEPEPEPEPASAPQAKAPHQPPPVPVPEAAQPDSPSETSHATPGATSFDARPNVPQDVPQDVLPGAPTPDFGPAQVIEPPTQSLRPLDLPEPPAPPLQGDREPSFVRQAQRRALWRRPWIRGSLLLLVLALAALLAWQVAVDSRDQLASHLPPTRPILDTLCAPLECKVEPPRQLEDIVIDSSILLRRAHGQYSFNVVIRNRSDREVAMPAIELTLTDIQDQVLVRRVLLPAEWPRSADTLGPGAEWPLQFDLALDHPKDRVMTGFRAILFYP